MMKNKTLRAITFIIVTIIAISTYVMTKTSGMENVSNILMQITIMPFFTFVMRSICNSSYAWIGGVILAGLARFIQLIALESSLAPNGYLILCRSILLILYIICCGGVFVPGVTLDDGNSCDCNKYCDCCVGECY